MSDKLKPAIEAAGGLIKNISKAKTINALVILVLVVLLTNTVLTQWTSYNDRKDGAALLEQIVILNKQNGELIKDQVQARSIKICVADNFDLAEEQWRDTKRIIGNTFEASGVGFPQELNLSFLKYDVKRAAIKDCLIFPDKIK